MKLSLFLILCVCLLGTNACHPKNKTTTTSNTVYVSLPPQQYLVQQIAGNLLTVRCILPSGISPETYDPSPRLIHELTQSRLVFVSNLFYFEQRLINNIQEQNKTTVFCSLTKGIETISGPAFKHETHTHDGGPDPHTWCSPKQMRISAQLAFEALKESYPEYADSFNTNFAKLNATISRLDSLAEQLLKHNKRDSFLIFHPTLTYLAHDYGLNQISVEVEGKEPSLKYMQQLITLAKDQGIHSLFVQREFDLAALKNIADAFDGQVVVIHPLSADWAQEMEKTIRLLNTALNE